MRHGTTFSINLDVMQCDFKNEYTGADTWPSELVLDFKAFRKDKAYMCMLREEELVDLTGKPINMFHLNEKFQIALITSIKNPTELKRLTDTIPHFE
jgi:hypothetical protein